MMLKIVSIRKIKENILLCNNKNMLDNNLLFSLVLSVINTIAFYFIKNSDETKVDKENINQELLILFGITFLSCFLLKLVLSGDLMKGGGKESVLTHATRAPF